MLVRSWFLLNVDSTSPPQSVQARNFSTIHAACAAGESVRPYVTVWGRVSWIRQ